MGRVSPQELLNILRRAVEDYWYNSVAGIGLIQSDEDGSNGSVTTETPPGLNIEKTSYIDTVKTTSTPAIQALTRIRTKAKCVETILRKAVIEPYQINGQIEGLRITGLDKILLARALLLKSGDIIRAVNGQPLSSKRRAYEIFKKARKLPTMKIELLRDGKQKLSYITLGRLFSVIHRTPCGPNTWGNFSPPFLLP